MKYTDIEAVEILSGLTDKHKFSNEDEAKVVQGMISAVLKRCSKDISFFLNNLVKVNHFETDEYVPFELKAGQQKFINVYEKIESTQKWLVVSKARQAGFTTLTNAIMFYHCLFHKNAYVMITAQKEDTSKKNLDAIRTMFHQLPWWFKTNCIEWDSGNTGRHSDSASQITFFSKITATEQKLQAFSASAKSIRGETPTALHWTETAFCDEAYEMAKSAFPALRRRKNSMIILESTSNGTGNFYADTVLSAYEGVESRFNLVFHPWHSDADYAETPPEDFKLTEDEQKLKEELDLSDDQIYFRRITIADNGGDVNSFRQEYPSTVEESFIATDNIFFTQDVMQKVRDAVAEANNVQRFDIKPEGISANEFGNTWKFAQAIPQYEYVMGVDSSGGTGDDYAVISVFDPFGKLVSVTRDNALRPDLLASVIYHIARQYNNAKVCIERNGIGNFILQALYGQLNYTNLYYSNDGKIGFNTTETSRRHILAQLQETIAEGVVSCPFPELLAEMQTFEFTENGKPQAKKGYKDDCVMGIALGIEAFKTFRPGIRDIDEIEQPMRQRKFAL